MADSITEHKKIEAEGSLEINTGDVFTVTGQQTVNGGAISNAGAVTTGENGVSDVKFTKNATSASGGAIYNDGANATVTLAGSAEGGIVFTANTASGTQESDGGGAIYNNSGTVTLSHVTFGGETTDQNNANIDANTAKRGGAIYNTGTLNLSGSVKFQHNKATSGSGGAIYNEGTITQTSGTVKFTNNTASDGGAIRNSHGAIKQTGGTVEFTNNTATYCGGAIWNEGINAKITLTDATFSGNTAENNGGAIYNTGYGSNAKITLTNATFTGNTATNNGGAIYNKAAVYNSTTKLYEGGTITLTDASFTGNTATNGYGGAIYNNRGTIMLTDATFTGNTATNNGGAIYNYDGTITQIGGTVEFTNNTATNGYGGAIYNTGTITLNNATFDGNTATNQGGAIWNNGTLTLGNAAFSGNKAGTVDAQGGFTATENGGGAIYNTGTLNLTGAVTLAGTETYEDTIYNAANSTLNFDISAMDANGTAAMISDWSKVTNDASAAFTITINAAQAEGDYLLVSNAATFDDMITIMGYKVSADAFHYQGKKYSFKKQDANLILTVEADSGASDDQLRIICNKGETVDISGKNFKNLDYKGDGGAIYNKAVYNSTTRRYEGTITLTDATFSGNTAKNNGGAIYNAWGTITLTNAAFTNNTSTHYGGAIDNQGGTITLTGASFSGNKACEGGAIYNSEEGTITQTGGTMKFTNNTAYSGGAIYNYGWEGVPATAIALTNAMFENNTATGTGGYDGGGAIYNCFNGTITQTNATFTSNTATNAGGAIHNHGTITLNNATFDGNTATNQGGAIWNNGTLTLGNAAFSGNKAGTVDAQGGFTATENGGGAIYNAGTLNLTGAVTLSTNTDTIYNAEGSTLNFDISGFETANTSAMISDWSKVTNDASAAFTITINAAQAEGDYLLVSNAATFDDMITIMGYQVSADAFHYQGKKYSFKKQDADLILTVEADPDTPDDPLRIICKKDETVDISGKNFKNLDYIGGNIAGEGDDGAIYNQGAITGNQVQFTNNTATNGGAIDNNDADGTITLTGATFTGNTSYYYGGAILNRGGTITLTDASFSGNKACEGGAIYNSGGTITQANATFTGNTAQKGGAIYNWWDGGTIALANAAFNENTAEYGGAIYNSHGAIKLTGATFTGNTSTYYGGAIFNNGTITLTNATFSGNQTAEGGQGSAIYNAKGCTINLAGTVTLSTGTDTVYNEGTLNLAGIMTFGTDSGNGKMLTNDANSTLNFDISAMESAPESAMISDWSRVTNDASAALTITIAADNAQATGDYKLASNFTADTLPAITVNAAGTADALGTFSTDNHTFTTGTGEAWRRYSLSKTDSDVLTFTIAKDNTPPAVSNFAFEQNGNQFTWNASDTGEIVSDTGEIVSGLASVKLTFSPTTSGEAIVKTVDVNAASFDANTVANIADGAYTVKITATDNAGNTTEATPTEWTNVVIDNAAPTVSNFAFEQNGNKFTWTGDGTGTDIAKYVLTFTGGTNSPITKEVTGTSFDANTATDITDGTYTVTIQATDAAGNSMAEPVSLTPAVKIDKTSPTVADFKFTQDGNQFSWNATDTGEIVSGLASVKLTFSKDGANDIVKTVDVTAASFDASATAGIDDGAYTVKITATDKAGNTTESSPVTATIDNTAPAAPACAYDDEAQLWTNQPIILTAALSDSTDILQYKIGDGAWNDGNSCMVHTNTTVCFREIDAAGNASPEKRVTITKIDNTPPAMPSISAVAGANGKLLVMANFSSDSVKGEYSADGVEYLACTGPVEMATADTLRFRGIDRAGNKSEATSYGGDGIQALPANPEDTLITSTPEKIEWTIPGSSPESVAEFSRDNFESAIAIRTQGSAFDLENLPGDNYQWKVSQPGTELNIQGKNPFAADINGGYFTSNANGIPDVFFAQAAGVWSDSFHARNDQTREIASITGKNRFQNVFSGSVSDANILYLTDDANGDALFQDDMYSRGSGAVRLDNIREIRAGAGGDVIDFTSGWLASGFSGTIIRGGDGDDTIWADGTDAKLFGDDGNDTLRGGKGNDLIAGGAGDDNLSGGGGSDVFAFGKDWGNDTIAWNPDDGGSLTLVFEDGVTLNTWDASATSLTSGGNTITFDGFTANDVTIQVGTEQIGADEYAKLSACGAFLGSTTQKVYENTEFQGTIASL